MKKEFEKVMVSNKPFVVVELSKIALKPVSLEQKCE